MMPHPEGSAEPELGCTDGFLKCSSQCGCDVCEVVTRFFQARLRAEAKLAAEIKMETSEAFRIPLAH